MHHRQMADGAAQHSMHSSIAQHITAQHSIAQPITIQNINNSESKWQMNADNVDLGKTDAAPERAGDADHSSPSAAGEQFVARRDHAVTELSSCHAYRADPAAQPERERLVHCARSSCRAAVFPPSTDRPSARVRAAGAAGRESASCPSFARGEVISASPSFFVH